MPLSRASCGLENAVFLPSSRISPPSYWKTPEIALITVDLPAPLSPAKATTSPGWTSSETLFSACTAPKCFETLRTERMGAWLIGVSLNLAASAHETALGLVDQDRDDDDRADGDELPERLDIDEDETVLDDRDDQGSCDRAPDRARTAEQAGAADHDRGDRIQQQWLARLGGTGREAAGIEDARDTGHH